MPHRMRCKENLIDCLNVSGAIKSGPKNDVRILNVNECENNTVEKFKSNLHSNAKYLKMVHFNAQGLLEGMHFEHICEITDRLNLDIILISETWLNKNVSNKMVAMKGFQIYRSDRNFSRELIKKRW